MSMTKIATVTVPAGGQASIDFNSIPGTMTDLFILLSGRTSGTGNWQDCKFTFNGGSTGYSGRWLAGTGSGAGSSSTDANLIARVNTSSATANTFDNTSFYVANYAGTTNKSVSIDNVGETNATTAGQFIVAGLSTLTSAITSISITPLSGTFAQYSSATLYGITKGSLAGVTVS